MNAERILVPRIDRRRALVRREVNEICHRADRVRSAHRPQPGGRFPIARAYAEIEAAALMVRKAAALFDAGRPCGPEANMGKLLGSEAAWHAGEAAMQCHGGFGFAREYDIERKWRETRLFQIAPISTNLVLAYIAEHVLAMPRSC
jgi:acyl-CoA dehydrogenase